MTWIKKIILLLTIGYAIPVFSQKKIELRSPDENLIFRFILAENASVYQVEYKGVILIDNSELSLSFKENGIFGKNLVAQKPQYKKVDETYDLVVGKTKTVRNQYREVVIPLTERKGTQRKVNFVVRAFNDGIGFRYEFPEQDNWKSYVLLDENSSFNITGNPTVYTLFWKQYNNNHEGIYRILPYEKVSPDSLMDVPALFEFPGKAVMAITEANLRDYAGMYLKKENGVLVSRLSPLQGQTEVKVKAQLPHRTPWRVLLISNRIGALIESNILTSLNDPSKIEDTSWIKPGKTSFHWWNGDVLPDSTIVPGTNFETNKYYIDFCARNNIEYHAVIGYGGFAWFPNNWKSYGEPGSFSDVTKSVASLDMSQICNYAKSKGVGINVWVHWKALYPQLEEAFTQFEKWGVKGMMVDFLDRDDQEMVNISEEILQCAARHKLYIQFHGAFKPTGLSRTYPNEFTREGTHNYEQNKWSTKPISPDHDLNVVFTRMLAGATDYHLGGFRAVPENKFKTQYTKPLMAGTRCHMLAMYVVLESYLSMVADYPSAYEGEPGFEFLRKVPTVWDQTVVPGAELKKYVVVARRKGEHWFVGALNNTTARTIDLSFDFLDKNKEYSMTIYQDSSDVQSFPNHLTKTVTQVKNNSHLKLDLAAGGGTVMEIIPINGKTDCVQ
jgi:alpha-glucosidase